MTRHAIRLRWTTPGLGLSKGLRRARVSGLEPPQPNLHTRTFTGPEGRMYSTVQRQSLAPQFVIIIVQPNHCSDFFLRCPHNRWLIETTAVWRPVRRLSHRRLSGCTSPKKHYGARRFHLPLSKNHNCRSTSRRSSWRLRVYPQTSRRSLHVRSQACE